MLIGKKDDWYPETWAKFNAVADGVDLKRLAYLVYDFDNVFDRSVLSRLMRYVVAQMKLDALIMTESNACVRPILPDVDFRTFVDDEIRVKTINQWWQPSSSVKTMDDYRARFDNIKYPVYLTNRNCNNDRKVILLFAHQDVSFDRHHVNKITIKVRDDEIYNTDLVEGNALYLMPFPILAKRGDDLGIYFEFKDDKYVNSHTNIKFYGIVGESAGNTMTG